MTRHALIAVHVMVAIDGGSFVSAIDPPAWARVAVASCRQALDPRAAAIVDRCDSFGPDSWDSLHGTIRSTKSIGG